MSDLAALLVDVDGVLNTIFPCNKPRETCPCHPGWTRVSARVVDDFGVTRRYRLTLNPEHGRMLLDLAAATDAELVWGTTWNDLANVWVSPTVGLPEDLPHVPIPPRPRKRSVGEWKAQWVAEWAAGRPFVWFDDEPDIPEILAGIDGVGPHLVITVREDVGLTAEHVAAAKEWLADLTV